MEPRFLAIAERLGYSFRDEKLLKTALTHSSYLNEAPEPIEDNERLEYLGDAVLDLLVGDMLYRQCPAAREGELTRWRSQLVNTYALAALAQSIGLGTALCFGRGEEANGGPQRPANLAAAFEALTAALYLDAGFGQTAQILCPLFEAAVAKVTLEIGPQDARSRLQELSQAHFGVTPRYRSVEQHGPDHARVFRVQVLIGDDVRGEGEGHSKRSAAQAAAEQAINQLGLA